MKRVKLIIGRDPRMAKSMSGATCALVDADTGEPIECAQDFRLNMPMDGAMTVDVRLLVSDVERVNGWPGQT